MYLAVAGSCAEDKANTVSDYDLSLFSLPASSSTNIVVSAKEATDLFIGGGTISFTMTDGYIRQYDFSSETLAIPRYDTTNTISTLNTGVTAIRGGTWGNSGTKLAYSGSNGTAYQRTSSAYTLTGIGSASTNSPGLGDLQGVAFNDTGTKVFYCRAGAVSQATLSTPWDIQTRGSFTSLTTSTDTDSDGGSINNLTCIRFSADGTKMFVSYRDSFGDGTSPLHYPAIAQYDLSTAFDVTSGTYSQNLKMDISIGTYPSSPYVGWITFITGFDWNATGDKLVIVGAHPAGNGNVLLFS